MTPSHPHATRLPRRALLASAALGAAALPLTPRAARAGRAEPDRAHNIVFCVSDGMSAGTLQLADRFCREHHGRESHWVRLWSRPGVRRAAQMTHAADGPVTDSAAAGSAWGIGEHVNNGAVNFTPDRREPTPILVEARARGKATGLVTTTRVTHATPAAFVANCPRRDFEDDIARQMLERRVDLILGGGAKHFPPEALALRPDLSVLRSADDLDAFAARRAAAPRPVLGLFARGHMDYEIDRPSAVKPQPTLERMARVALAELGAAPDGFILQIEGGRVDHAAHNNDAAALVRDQVAFDDAIGAVLEFCDGRDDTLVIVTTDHANANPGLTIYGPEGQAAWTRLAGVTRSFDAIFETLASRAPADANALAEVIEDACRVTLHARERDILARAFLEKKMTDAFGPANAAGPVLGSVLANHFGVAWVSPNHTADYVELTAFGPGSERVGGLMDNIELHGLMRHALAFDHAAIRR